MECQNCGTKSDPKEECRNCGMPVEECLNCGMIDVPLTRDCCQGCICLKCKKTAVEAGCSMNEYGWCNSCEEELRKDLS